MRVYKYDKQRYLFAVVLPTFLMAVVLVYSIINNLKNQSLNIYTLYIVVAVYGLINNIISLSNPSKIVDNGKEIIFYSFGRSHIYSWKNIKYMRIKELYGKKIYLRIDNPSLLMGRYWIKTTMYNDGNELYEKLTRFEKKLHPDLLKFRTKTSDKEEAASK